jgi:secreted Zn-dependent insulinase-like peptidase
VSGYHHKLIVLVQKIIDKVVNFEVEEERFSVIKVLCSHLLHRYSCQLGHLVGANKAPMALNGGVSFRILNVVRC